MSKRLIYMAGKIEKGDWRTGYYRHIDDSDLYAQAMQGKINFPIVDIGQGLKYTGPYFVSCDHGCFHGDATHGAGVHSCECGDYQSRHTGDMCANCGGYCWAGGCNGSGAPFKNVVFSECCDAIINRTNTFFAWIDNRECYGTIAEIGLAHGVRGIDLGHCEDIWIASPEVDPELWFVYEMATDFTIATSPNEALDYFLNKHNRVDYYEYIKSDDWREKAMEAKLGAEFRCQICNEAGDFSSLHAHHRTYERLGMELPGDITVLCAGCHKIFHDNGRVVSGNGSR